MSFKIEREEFITKTFRLNTKLVERAEIVCSQKNISLNKFVDLALRYALDNMEKDDINA